ncbi:OB-fold nucleic acid binding domain-containing protein (plasmid) [Halobacillus litoralis]|uniref:helix-hairpin-helix domain-containing protein n=1 Tax=Halobacillus litoralis TaxID=45668 RepID=UPI001CFE99A1|nr:OB-fold nucleic acid binding domain-containing protein [Halobacillus litoralis]WLR49557.1 OB-fold nucleic acid binding domain-containing protein [Halobacillus litoralis]
MTTPQTIMTHKGEFDVLDIPLDDEKTLDLLRNGHTSGVFQLESDGMKQLLRQLQPKSFKKIIDVLALYRPAPLSIKGDDGLTMVERYIKVEHGEIEPEYIHEDLRPILEKTNGQLLYQEQMMQISRKFGGFSQGRADTLRKAMGKKKEDLMAELKDEFIEGCTDQYNADLAKELWQWIEKGAGYLFNKSHSADYGLISWQTAYLKAHEPIKFMASIMSSELQDESHSDKGKSKKKTKSKKLEKIAFYVDEAKQQGIEVKPPLINQSQHRFVEDDGRIIFSLNAIKGVGSPAIAQVIENKPYANFDDFLDCNVFKGSEVKKGAIVGLIKAGAFDETDPDRVDLLKKYMETRPKKEREPEKHPVSFDDEINPNSTMLRWEKEVTGLYMSGHPLDKYSFIPFDDVRTGYKATIGGELSKVKQIRTKKGKDMAFLDIDTPEGKRDCVLFPHQFNKYKGKLTEGEMVIIEGEKEERNGEFQVIVDKIQKV